MAAGSSERVSGAEPASPFPAASEDTECHFPPLPLQEKQIPVAVPCLKGDHPMLPFGRKNVIELSKAFQSHHSAWVRGMIAYIS